MELETGHITVTDHGTLQACRQVYDLCQEKAYKGKLKPILGLEAYVRDENCSILLNHGIQPTKTKEGKDTFLEYNKYYHITLHAQDQMAYEKLVKLLSKADSRAEKHGSERKPLFDWNDLEEIGSTNTTMTSGCLIGMVQRHLIGPTGARPDIAEAYYSKLRSLAKPGNFFVEVFPHVCDRNWDQAVFLTFNTPEGEKTERFQTWKKVKTAAGAFSMEDLGKECARNGPKRFQDKHKAIYEIMNNRKWIPYESVNNLISAEHKEGFIKNDCTPEAPDGDIQYYGNKFVLEMAKKYKDPVIISDDCVVKGTLVRTNLGMKPVELISPGELVYTHTGKLQKVISTRGLFSNKKILTLNSRRGNISLTEDHRILVKKAPGRYYGGAFSVKFEKTKDPIWISAKEVEVGDFILSPCPTLPERVLAEKIDLSKFFTHRNKSSRRIEDNRIFVLNKIKKEEVNYSRFINIDEDFAFIVGLFLGDGNAHNNLLSFALDNETYENIESRLLKFAKKYSFSYDITPEGKPGALRHRVFRFINSSLTTFFRREFYDSGKHKTVPQWFSLLPVVYLNKMAEGLFYSDGTDRNGTEAKGEGSVTLSMTSLQVVTFLSEVLMSQGVYCSLSRRRTSGSTHELYTLSPTSKILDICELWKRNEKPSLKPQLWLDGSGFWFRVNSIEEFKGESPVYDLEVENDHSFATNLCVVHNCHFATPDEKIIQDIRLMSSGGAWRFSTSYHRQSSNDAWQYFSKKMLITERTFEGWLENNAAWASKFNDFKFKYEVSLPTRFYPSDSLQETYSLIDKHGRMDWTNQVYKERLESELQLLHKNGKIDLLPYFFIDEDICSFYESQGKLTGPGRGSAAGLLLSYLEGITHVDPLKFNLSQERFITQDRIDSGALPDIDQDLSDRDILLNPETGYLWKRFGTHACQISTDTMLRLRSSVRDVSRVTHGHVLPEVEELAKKFLETPQGVSDKEFVFGREADGSWVKGTIETDPALKAYVNKYPKEWAIVQKLLGLSRSKGRHPCAHALSNEPITNNVPTTSVSDIEVTQYTFPSVEATGLVKMDFLGVNSLKDIENCLKLIQSKHLPELTDKLNSVLKRVKAGEEYVPSEASVIIDGKRVPIIRVLPFQGKLVDIWDLPEDQSVFNDICEGKTETVFQFSTPSAVKWLKEFNYIKKEENGKTYKALASIEDLAAFVALDRPGPLDVNIDSPEGGTHNALVEYARRSRGDKPAVMLKVFDELFPETYSVLTYQEQMQKAFQVLTGCSGAEAESFRRDVAKKKADKIQKIYPVFMERAGAKLGKAVAQTAWDFFGSWAAYGFNKSHAVCYATIGYACAYLKHHFPLEWWTAVLGNASKEEINNDFWRHCGHLIDLPDVNMSGNTFFIRNNKIQAPISLLHGVGDVAHAELCELRPFTTLEDFCLKIENRRVKNATTTVEKVVLEKLTKKQEKEGLKIGQEIEVTKTRKARSALTRAVAYPLIISGAMDSLFPDSDPTGLPLNIVDKLMLYESAQAMAQGKSKPQPIDEKFIKINGISRYQMQKKILPAYTEDLPLLLLSHQVPGLKRETTGAYSFVHESRDSRMTLRVASLNDLKKLTEIKPWPVDYTVLVAVPSYVEDSRVFQYTKDGNTKEAMEFIFDIEGSKERFVLWGRDKGRVPLVYKKQSFNGSMVMAILSKRNENRPFSVEDVILIQNPLALKEDD
jgi:DNA polymerase III alpha subunit/intein/homing endonuclease